MSTKTLSDDTPSATVSRLASLTEIWSSTLWTCPRIYRDYLMTDSLPMRIELKVSIYNHFDS